MTRIYQNLLHEKQLCFSRASFVFLTTLDTLHPHHPTLEFGTNNDKSLLSCFIPCRAETAKDYIRHCLAKRHKINIKIQNFQRE